MFWCWNQDSPCFLSVNSWRWCLPGFSFQILVTCEHHIGTMHKMEETRHRFESYPLFFNVCKINPNSSIKLLQALQVVHTSICTYSQNMCNVNHFDALPRDCESGLGSTFQSPFNWPRCIQIRLYSPASADPATPSQLLQ